MACAVERRRGGAGKHLRSFAARGKRLGFAWQRAHRMRRLPGEDHLSSTEEFVMSKGMNQKKSEKKKPEKTMKEKKAEKNAKKAAKPH